MLWLKQPHRSLGRYVCIAISVHGYEKHLDLPGLSLVKKEDKCNAILSLAVSF
jgi:hypothetical protein